MLQELALELLDPHPHNANRMTDAMMTKLIAHLRESDQYPPLIVRVYPDSPGRYQLLDGHHRAAALKTLSRTHARCCVWEADDDRAALLLLTLNRLHGEDDPQRRGFLLERLSQSIDAKQLASLLPDPAARIRALIDLNHNPSPLAPSSQLADMPQAVTFFLTSGHRNRLFEKLEIICRDRSEALARLLMLDTPATGAEKDTPVRGVN